MDCVFCKIRDGQIPKEFEYEDEDIMVFEDIKPIKPIHLLIIPKEHIEDFHHLEDKELELKINKTIREMISKKDLDKKGFKVFLNGGGAQIVDHLHIHLTGPWSKGA
jgi:histidine triad (HIT) family protein